MPFILILLAVLFIAAGLRGTQGELFSLLKGDFTGDGNFIAWCVAVFLVGAIGYIPQFKPFSNAFLVLIVVSFIVRNGGFFQKFQDQVYK